MPDAPAESPIDIRDKYAYDGRTMFRISVILLLLSVSTGLLISLPILLFVAALAWGSAWLFGLWLLSIVVLVLVERVMG